MSARTYPHGVPCWVDTEQPDVDAAAAFYGGLFGWQFTDVMPAASPASYLMATLDGQDVAAIGTGRADAPVAWHTYVAVDDADATAAAVAAGGGTVLAEPRDAGPGGRAATCADPEGAVFRLWQARRRLGAQAVNMPGAWNFSDLHTAGDGAFYRPLFGWEIEDLGFATTIRVPGYGDHLEATVDPGIRERQAAVSTPVGFEDAVGWVASLAEGGAPGWHVTFTVAGRDDAVARAQSLGATVLSSAETRFSRTALVRDPQGAEFTASQFTPPGD